MGSQKSKQRAYFKKWYEEKGRQRRGSNKRKDYSLRNQRIHQMYMDLSKHYSIGSIAKIFHISPPRVFKIIKQEDKKLKESTQNPTLQKG